MMLTKVIINHVIGHSIAVILFFWDRNFFKTWHYRFLPKLKAPFSSTFPHFNVKQGTKQGAAQGTNMMTNDEGVILSPIDCLVCEGYNRVQVSK